MGAMGGWFSAGDRLYSAQYIMLGCFLVLAITGAVSARLAEPDYRKVVSTLLYVSGTGLFLMFLFFGLLRILAGDGAMRILLAVMLPLYGLALVMAGAAHHYMSQGDYRPFMYDFFRQLPYLYYRYRT